MDEMTVLREAFGPDPAPPREARNRARAALLQHIILSDAFILIPSAAQQAR